jgi:hypothetical protein
MGSSVLDEHFRWLEVIRETYQKRGKAPEYLDQAIAACEAQIALAPDAARAFRRDWPDSELPSHTGYKQLCIIREKQGQLEEALRLAEAALAAGWSGDWEQRIERLRRKQAKRAPRVEPKEPAGPKAELSPSDDSWSTVTCLCLARLRVRQHRLEQTARCPRCEGAVYLRPQTASGDPCETAFLKAQKVSQRGKARWRTPDGHEGFVEEVVLSSFLERGWNGVWGENDLWWVLWSLLFWDVIFARIDGVWNPRFGDFPSQYQDMPSDLFGHEFYPRRRSMIEARLKELHSEADLAAVVQNSYDVNYGRKCRPIADWDKFPVEVLCEVVSSVSPRIVCGIFRRLMMDFAENRSGLPDLLLWNPTENFFAEVKGGAERLSQGQWDWIEYLRRLGCLVIVVRVLDR